MNDETTTWTLTELAETEDVTPRTVRYYIAQGLLPPPLGAGPSTRYGYGHALRLRLIRELQRQHLPLAEIRSRLEHLRDDEVAGVLTTYVRRPGPAASESALDYIRAVLSPPPAPPAMDWSARTGPRAPAAAAAAPSPTQAPKRLVGEAPAGYAEPPPPPNPAAGPARSQWDRIALTPDIELHVRRPLSRFQNRAVDRLIVVARQLLEEDTP